MPLRVTFLLQNTTSPTDRGRASPHTGGWSESWWTADSTSIDTFIASLAQARANLLPAQASVVGFRKAVYDVVGNRIIPRGSSTGKFQYPGNANRPCDLPQVALEMSGQSAGAANSSRFVLRGMPDEIMVNGEYQPSSSFAGSVTTFCNALISGQWKFLGRDLTRPSGRVISIVNRVLTVESTIGGAVNDFVRMRRVYDSFGRPVTGTFRIEAIGGGGTTYTLANFDATITVANSGTARIDALNTYTFTTVTPSRAVVKKVGRPFEAYRGRQSKRR